VVDGIRLESTRKNLEERKRLYLEYGCKKLRLSNKVKTYAWDILQKYKGGVSTRLTVASALYIACAMLNERRSQREIARVFNTIEVSIRRVYKDMLEKLSRSGMRITIQR